MSLDNTHDIGNVKIVMVGAGGSGGSYTAGSGISIFNSVITNIRKGALTGVIDSVSSNIAHTQITGARDTFAAGALILLQSEAAGTADNLRIQYGAQSSDSQTFAIYDTSSTAASITIASGDTVIMMIDNTGYRAIILNVLSASGGSSYAGLGIGKKKTVTNNIIDTDIDLHRAPIVGDRLLVYFDEKVTNPIGLTTYNNGTAVTSNLENAVSLYINAGWNILQFMNDGLLYDNCWVRKQNVPVPSTLAGMSDTAIVSPSDGQLLTFDNETQKWKNKTYIEANTGSPVTELKKLKVGNVVYDTDGLKNYSVTNVANNNITVSVLNPEQFVQEVIAINTGSHTGSSSAWNLVLSGGMIPVSVALTRADGSAFNDDITENELLLIYVDTAGNVARVLDIPVNTTEIKTVSGNPITLTDAIAGNALEVSAEIVASQDLHGYDKPWVGGAGKNKLKYPYRETTKTDNGVTLTDKGDGTIETSGTASARVTFSLQVAADNFVPPSGSYILSKGFTNSSIAVAIDAYNGTSWVKSLARSAGTDDVSFTVDYNGYDRVSVFIDISNGANTNGITIKPMIRLSTASNGFEPYSNICPISGYSTVTITDVDSESHTATVTVSLGQTIYGGTLDLTSGELTVDKGIADLGSLDWWRSTSYTNAFFYANISDSIADGDNNIISSCYETIESRTSGQFGTIAENGQIAKSSNSIQVFVRDDSYNDASAFKTARTGQKIVYELATPTTTTLTAEQLALVKGYNQLSCNSGDMEITYKASGLDALKERVDELEDRVDDVETELASKAEKTTIGTVESGTTASQAYAVGEHFIRNDKFCTCISAIASGATLTLNTNYVEGTIAENLSRATTYSSSETEIGTWNGQKLYRKVIDCGGVIQGTKYTSSGVSGAITVRHLFATAYSSGYQMPLPFLADGYEWSIGLGFVSSTDAEHPNSVRITCRSDQSVFSSVIAVLEYTKNS